MENHDEHSLKKHSPGFVIPAGTQVVIKVDKTVNDRSNFRKAGAVGVVAECPQRADGEYVVEFANGDFVRATFEELTLRRKEIDMELDANQVDFRQYVIYRCRVGSRAYGLAHEDSDDDVRGFFLPPADLHWSLFAVPEQIERLEDGDDEVFWELEKFVRLCLKANPNMLEVLWTPDVIETNEIADELRNIRRAFVSQHIYKTYSGYVLSQFRRMKNRFEKTGDYKVKHAMHLVRLLHSGIHAIRTGDILVNVEDHRDLLLNIRSGEWSFEEVRQFALKLDDEFQTAFASTKLPEQPDLQKVDRFLIRARRWALDSFK